jgi:hypothetical protein
MPYQANYSRSWERIIPFAPVNRQAEEAAIFAWKSEGERKTLQGLSLATSYE